MKTSLTTRDVLNLAKYLIPSIKAVNDKENLKIFPIPNGGIPAAYALASVSDYEIVDHPVIADFFIDDIIDSGTTMKKWQDQYPNKPFFALIDHRDEIARKQNGWIVFPWEQSVETGIEDNIRRILQNVDPDPGRGGLVETPARVAKAWQYWTKGYTEDPAAVLKVFEDGAENYDEMITVKDIPFYSQCEHHLAPFFGTATVSYIPRKHIVGLSKISRVVDIFARRLQVQERMTAQIADALNNNLEPVGVGVMIKARHLCMESRGICQQGHHTVTTSLKGAMLEHGPVRNEFLKACE